MSEILSVLKTWVQPCQGQGPQSLRHMEDGKGFLPHTRLSEMTKPFLNV